MIAHLTADLMMASTAKATATANGLEYRSFPNLNAMEQALPDDTIHLLLVDLQLANLDLAQLTDIVKQHFSDEQHRCVAYAQHVQVDLLEQAQECGFHAIMTRGQINSGMANLFSTL